MTTTAEFQQLMLDRMVELAKEGSPQTLLRLAEAYAWMTAPCQHHGSQTS